MGKWIRQRLLLIAERLISRGRNFILKLQEDGLTEKSIMRRKEGLRDWPGLRKKEEKEKEDKRNKGGKPFYGKVCPNNREGERHSNFRL